MITILLISFISLFLILGILMYSRICIKEILLRSVIVFSTLLVFITELTSLFHVLNYQNILISWIGISVLNIIYLIGKKRRLVDFTILLIQKLTIIFKELSKFEKYLFLSVLIILIFAFIQGIIYPPNNCDSMTYHLGRIPNWISHKSVEHYPTNIYRQLFQPPFAEFVVMHFNILNIGDTFSNSVQFFFLIFSIIAIVLVVEQFGLGRKYKLIAIVLTVTIPEVILQASSTQNDIVVSFFIITTLYFAIKTAKIFYFENYIFFGLSIGLGVLSKGTSYIYLTPILLIYGIITIINLFKTKNISLIFFLAIAFVAFISINSGHYIRNYNLTKNLLGISKIQTPTKDFNEDINMALFLSNISKNAALHVGPYPINHLAYMVIYKIHALAGLNCDETNFMGWSFSIPNIPNHEDRASNPVHFVLTLLAFILIVFHSIKNKIVFSKPILYLALILLQALLFCYVFKWTPWNSRLHTPLFMLSIPLICYAINLNVKFINMFYNFLPFMLFYAFCVVILNFTRPFITITHPFSFGEFTSPISVFDNRYKKYFVNRFNTFDEYNEIRNDLSLMKNGNIGIIVGYDDWEYPLFCQFYGKNYNPIHINVSNISKVIPIKHENIDCVISTTINDSVFNFNGKNYYNRYRNHKYIWYYK